MEYQSGVAAVNEQDLRRFSGFDIVGDVHGCAAALRALLGELGYVEHRGVYRYRDQKRPRQLIFLGDIVDRGPGIREAFLIAHDMVEAGHAQMVMGNHEYDALGYCTEALAGSGPYLRAHNERHDSLIAETLEQFANHPQDWRDALSWFIQLPLFLDFGTFRVVHACWDSALIERFLALRGGPYIDWDFLRLSADENTFAHQFLHRTTRGMDMLLPNGVVMTSAEGYRRRFFRIKYWCPEAATYGDIQFQPDPLPPEIAELPISAALRQQLCLYGPDQPPLFFGHYWQDGKPRPQTDNVACLDYSAVNGGRLAAYRMDGESRLSADKFVWVDGQE